MTSHDIREVGCFALFSTSEVVENRTNGPLKPVLLRGSSTTSFMWSFGWLTRLGSSFLKIFWPDISKNSGTDSKTAGGKVISAGKAAATTLLREGHESLDRAPRSGLIVGHAA